MKGLSLLKIREVSHYHITRQKISDERILNKREPVLREERVDTFMTPIQRQVSVAVLSLIFLDQQ